jgi:hypothetical protein
VLPQPGVCNPALTLTCHIPYSKNNIAPRVGFAYSIDGKGSTVIRASFGLFYIQEDLLDVSQALLSNGISRPFLFTKGPGFGNSTPVVTYPNSLTSFPGGTPSATVFSPVFRSPYVEQANLAVEHKFGGNTALSVGYVYSHGLSLLGNSNGVTRQALAAGSDLNLVPPALQQDPRFGGPTAFTQDTVFFPDGKSFVVPDSAGIDGILNPNFGAINVIDNTGSSVYNALLVSLRHTSSQFFTAVAYTFSKTIDQGTGYYNQFDQQSQRGPSQLDQRQRFVLSGGWTPTSGPLRHFIVAGVLNEATGRPYTAVFDTTSVNFSMVPGEAFNSFTGPGVNNFDFSMARDIHLGEKFTFGLKAESFNLFNHSNFQQNPVNSVQYTTNQRSDSMNNPINVWDATLNPSFGTPVGVVSRFGSRAFQFSTRFSF